MNGTAQQDAHSLEVVSPEIRRYDTFDLAAFPEESRYKFLTGSVVPRPIALVTSLGENGDRRR